MNSAQIIIESCFIIFPRPRIRTSHIYTTINIQKKANQSPASPEKANTCVKEDQQISIPIDRIQDSSSTSPTPVSHDLLSALRTWWWAAILDFVNSYRHVSDKLVLTSKSTKGAGALSTDREAASVALDDTSAASIRTDSAGARGGTVATLTTSGRRRRLAGAGSGLLGVARRGGRRSALLAAGASGNGRAFTTTVLLDSHCLEHGLRLFGGGVDGEDHALTAMTLLLAVKPCIQSVLLFRSMAMDVLAYREE